MIVTLLSWGVIFVFSVILGNFFIRKIMPETFQNTTKFDVYFVAGLMILNVYAQVFSIFGKVSMMAFCFIAVIVLILFVWCMSELKKEGFSLKISGIATWKICVSIVLGGAILLLTIKSPEFVDTYLYHAQAIRWIEEYGVVPGLGNLHCRFAYNSAFLPLQALFSFSWLTESMHSLNGFLGCFFVIYAVVTNHIFSSEKNTVSDYLKLMIIPYIFLNKRTLSSPGTDVLAMLLVLYIAIKWSECIEKQEKSIQSYGFLCILAVWALSVKLSTAASLVLVIFPAVILIKKRQWKLIVKDLICGIAVAIPWLVRNVIISGYLIYPYSALDLFSVDWKMSKDILELDKMEITVYGREVRDVTLYSDPITVWFSTWFENQMLKYKLLVIAGFAATVFLLCVLIIALLKYLRKKVNINSFFEGKTLLLLGAMLLSEVFWLFSAPLVRYGMVFLMMPIAVSYYLIEQKLGNKWNQFILIVGTFAITFFVMYKSEDFRLFWPQGYWKMESVATDFDGVIIYTAADGGKISGYDVFPAAPKKEDLEKIELRGNNLSDGFRVKE